LFKKLLDRASTDLLSKLSFNSTHPILSFQDLPLVHVDYGRFDANLNPVAAEERSQQEEVGD